MFRGGRRIRLGVPNPHPHSATSVLLHASEHRRGVARVVAARVAGPLSQGAETAQSVQENHTKFTTGAGKSPDDVRQARNMTVRCTMKLMQVAVPCATTKARVISPVIGGSRASRTAFIPTWTTKVIP